MADSAPLEAHVRSFVEHRLMLDPWLADLDAERFSFASQEMIARASDGLAAEYWREPLIGETLGTLPALRTLGRRVCREILDSTAAAVAHERVGRLRVDAALAREAIRRLESFVADAGFGAAVRVYLAVATVKNYGALIHFGKMAEDDFVRAIHHRPWLREPIDGELMRGIALGEVRLFLQDGRRYVKLTARGRNAWRDTRRLLADAGYLAERMALVQLSGFNRLEDYDTVIASVVPHETSWRGRFTGFVGVRSGASVLDVGCGPGSQVYDGGLLAAVGADGAITGLDPARGMLDRAQHRAGARNGTLRWVQGVAERLPFADATFDVAMGVQILHLTDLDRALAEMRRVTRPGGRVAHAGACAAEGPRPAWLSWWLAPARNLARRYAISESPGRFPAPGELTAHFAEAGLVGVRVESQANLGVLADTDAAVWFLVRSQAWLQRVLEILPWSARYDLIQELVDRGRDLTRRLRLEERTFPFPSEFICGEVPGEGVPAP